MDEIIVGESICGCSSQIDFLTINDDDRSPAWVVEERCDDDILHIGRSC